MHRIRTVRYFSLTVLAAMVFLMSMSFSAVAAEEPFALDEKADQLLRAMGAQLATATQFTYRVKRTIDPPLLALKDAKVAEETVITGAMKRPNKLMARSVSKKYERLIVYDGATFMILDVKPNVYAAVPLSGNIDTLVRELEEEFGFSPPGVDFLVSDPYAFLIEHCQSGKYIGPEKVADAACDHLAFQEELIDWDIWLAADTHLPVKVVVTAKGIEGKPKMSVVFQELDLASKVGADTFTFKPPQDAVKAKMGRFED